MFGGRKKKPGENPLGAPLTINLPSGEELYTFAPEVVSSFRHMITGLACNGGIPSRMAVISALREEGVTHTSLALATVLASDTSATVCAVELNWWAPGMVAMLSRGKATPPEQPRLAAVVSGAATLDEALIPTSLPNLSLLPAGEISLEQRPVVARSAALRAVIDELSARFSHLVLDVPAVMATSDAIALASLGDACAVVVRHGTTPTQSVQLALDDVKHLKMLGVVLNKASFHTPRWLLSLVPQE